MPSLIETGKSYLRSVWGAAFSGTEQITLFVHKTSGDVSYTVQNCASLALTEAEAAPSDGVYVDWDRDWLVNVADLPVGVAGIKPADRIRDVALTDWTVLTASLNTLGTRWRLRTRNLVLANDLQDLIDIYGATNTQDAARNRVSAPTATPLYASVPARVQEATGELEPVFSKQALGKRFVAYLGQRVAVTNEMQVKLGTTVYQINGYRYPDRIDRLMELDLEVMP